MKDHLGARTMLRERDRHQDEHTLLALYLNGHLAGATAGLALCRDLAEAERSSPLGMSETLSRLAAEIAQDRSTLVGIMSALSVPIRRYKVGAGWVSEKAAHLMPHGSVLGRTRLNTLVELETLWLGVQGKASLWRSLGVLADSDERLANQLDSLLDRAHGQAAALEELHARAAAAALRPPRK
jgi:hypothetical protein